MNCNILLDKEKNVFLARKGIAFLSFIIIEIFRREKSLNTFLINIILNLS
jgi:hypothetical protein